MSVVKTVLSTILAAYVTIWRQLKNRKERRTISLRKLSTAIAMSSTLLQEFGTRLPSGFWVVLRPEHGGVPRTLGELMDANHGVLFVAPKPRTKLVIVEGGK